MNLANESLFDRVVTASFEKGVVHFLQPSRDKWFNMFVLHQNRVHHTPKGYIGNEHIDDIMDLVQCALCSLIWRLTLRQVVWGHEHECLIEPTSVGDGEFSVSQPGSSVATSLTQVQARTIMLWLMPCDRANL